MHDCDPENARQRWHLANQWKSLRAWNTDQCLTEQGNSPGARFLGTAVCDITGAQPEQHLAVDEAQGKFVVRPAEGRRRCLNEAGESVDCGDGSGGPFSGIAALAGLGGGGKGGGGKNSWKEWKIVDRKEPLEMEKYRTSGWPLEEDGR